MVLYVYGRNFVVGICTEVITRVYRNRQEVDYGYAGKDRI